MDLGNIREHGVRFVAAICQEVNCGHSGLVNVDGLPDDVPVPSLGPALRTGPISLQELHPVRSASRAGFLVQDGQKERAPQWHQGALVPADEPQPLRLNNPCLSHS